MDLETSSKRIKIVKKSNLFIVLKVSRGEFKFIFFVTWPMIGFTRYQDI